jgi:hypothetical protein
MLLEAKCRFYYAKKQFINIIIKDSYSIISMPLKKFGKSFKIDQEKEILPYSMYNEKTVKTRYLPEEECKKYCNHQVKCDNLDRVVTKQDEEE